MNQLTNHMTQGIFIVGVGNQYRHDDGAGLEVVRRIKKLREDIECVEQSGEGVQLMDTWKERNHVILIDAVSSSKAPGTLHCINANKEPLPKNWFSCSTHNFGVAEAVEMSNVMDTLPVTLQIFGIEGNCFDPGEGLTPEVEQAVNRVVEQIQSIVDGEQ
ncbi:MAG: hydrogenase maturation protease [Candidatus Nitronauta litoralis]|uniref:Hydrogenase maturation protease n=1 Tax=Candidatus Nitronauta litoralis TaxID=2705533 RepID=A0A7T0FZU7_9BACT|nr:MAG: hydrogenase maturation protease [Candidatus Nitronauta litoralis]